jgi:hypothetical protein
MDEGEVKQENTGYPAVYCSVGLNVWVVEHAFNVLRVDFYDEVADADNPQTCGS